MRLVGKNRSLKTKINYLEELKLHSESPVNIIQLAGYALLYVGLEFELKTPHLFTLKKIPNY